MKQKFDLILEYHSLQFQICITPELSMGRLDQARTRPEPENASPNPAQTRK